MILPHRLSSFVQSILVVLQIFTQVDAVIFTRYHGNRLLLLLPILTHVLFPLLLVSISLATARRSWCRFLDFLILWVLLNTSCWTPTTPIVVHKVLLAHSHAPPLYFPPPPQVSGCKTQDRSIDYSVSMLAQAPFLKLLSCRKKPFSFPRDVHLPRFLTTSPYRASVRIHRIQPTTTIHTRPSIGPPRSFKHTIAILHCCLLYRRLILLFSPNQIAYIHNTFT